MFCGVVEKLYLRGDVGIDFASIHGWESTVNRCYTDWIMFRRYATILMV